MTARNPNRSSCPPAFPNLLANGAAGIAVGMATSIPPHNAGEVCNAALALIADPSATTADLLAHMPGPDFPTGGVLIEDPAAILNAYETGRGGFRLRCRWEVEKLKNGQWQIVVTEMPYQTQKAKLIEQMAELLEAKKLPLLGDVRDESTETVRLILEPKVRTIEPAVLMETLFRATALEGRFPPEHERIDRRPHAHGVGPARRAAPLAGSPRAGARAVVPATAWRRSSGGWKSSTASSPSSSTSTKSSASSARRTTPRPG